MTHPLHTKCPKCAKLLSLPELVEAFCESCGETTEKLAAEVAQKRAA